MILAFLLLTAQEPRPIEDLIRDLRDASPDVRQRATQDLLARGPDVVPAVREALARETDPEAVSRLRAILDGLLRVRVQLRVEPDRVGRPLTWNARLVNEKENPVVLARSLDGSDVGMRYPHVSFEVVDPDGRPVTFPSFGRCGNMNELQAADFAEVPPGGAFDPFGEGAFGHSPFSAWRPDHPGTYRVRFTYDTSSADWTQWAGDGRWRERLDLDVASLLERVHHERLVSDWVEVRIDP